MSKLYAGHGLTTILEEEEEEEEECFRPRKHAVHIKRSSIRVARRRGKIQADINRLEPTMAKTRREIPADMQEALVRRDLSALQLAISKAQAAESSGFLGGTRGALRTLRNASRWTKSLNNNSQTPIALAIKQRWLEGLAAIAVFSSVENDCDLAKGYSPLDLCADARWPEGLSALVEKASGTAKQGALENACRVGCVKCVDVLLRHGATATPIVTIQFTPPIIAAVLSGNLECVKALTTLGASPWNNSFKRKAGGEWIAIDSPFMLAISGKNPSWEIAHHFLDLGTPKKFSSRRKAQSDELNRSPLMVIMTDPKLLGSALAFKKDGVDGEALLWRLAEDARVDQRDKNGLGWEDYAHRKEPSKVAMEFKRRLMEKMGLTWRFANREAAVENVQEGQGGSQVEKLSSDVAGDATLGAASGEDVDAAPTKGYASVEQCLAAMAAMTTAMAAMASAMGSLAAEVNDRNGVEEGAASGEGAHLEKKALALMEKAVEMRGQIAEIANKPCGDRRAGKP